MLEIVKQTLNRRDSQDSPSLLIVSYIRCRYPKCFFVSHMITAKVIYLSRTFEDKKNEPSFVEIFPVVAEI